MTTKETVASLEARITNLEGELDKAIATGLEAADSLARFRADVLRVIVARRDQYRLDGDGARSTALTALWEELTGETAA